MQNKPIQIINEINNSKIISFDIFDTLITRNLFKPSDIFFYVGIVANQKLSLGINPEKFVELRIQTEKEVRDNSKYQEITLDEIYSSLAAKLFINTHESNTLKNIELETEKLFSVQRKSMYEIYQYCINEKKQIFFTSDMYLPEDFIIELLHQNGYLISSKDNVILSSTHKKLKYNGELFNILYSKSKAKSKKEILHIGDNFNVDIKGARKFGIKAYYSENVHQEFIKIPEIANIFKDAKSSSIKLATSLSLSLYSHKFCDSIHASQTYDKTTLFNKQTYNLGYLGLGLFLNSFCNWLIDFGINNKINKFYFLARDGEILKECYDIIAKYKKNCPKSHYLISSRRMYILPAIKNKKDLNLILNNNYQGTVENFVTNRLGLSLNDSNVYNTLKKQNINKNKLLDSTKNNEDIRIIVDSLSELILQQCEIERKNLLQYLSTQINDFSDNYALVDLGYNGTIVTLFNKITNQNKISINVAVDSNSHERNELPYNQKNIGYIYESIPFTNYNYNLKRIIPMLESCFSSKVNQAVRCKLVNNNIEIEYLNDTNSQNYKRVHFVEELRRGTIDFINDYNKIVSINPRFFEIDPITPLNVLSRHFSSPQIADMTIWDGVYFENNYAGWSNKAIFSSVSNFSSIWNADTFVSSISSNDVCRRKYISNSKNYHKLILQKNKYIFLNIITCFLRKKFKNKLHEINLKIKNYG